MSQYTGSIPVDDVVRWNADATQRLLGYTIGIGEDEWHRPTPLPGWSRAHVATHLSRSADHLRGITEAVGAGLPQPEPLPASRRFADLEAGADRDGLALQIDLDTSAGALQAAIERVTDWSAPVELHGLDLTLAAVPLARLHEVCVHHLDLDCGWAADAIDPAAAAWLLRWVLDLLADAGLPALHLEGDSVVADIGDGADRRSVSGSDARLWAWLAGRLSASRGVGSGRTAAGVPRLTARPDGTSPGWRWSSLPACR